MLKKFIVKPLILFLLLSQFATIVHATEHQFSHDEHENCSVCMHGYESKNLLFDTNKLFSSDNRDHEKIANAPRSDYLKLFSDHNARSPPNKLV